MVFRDLMTYLAIHDSCNMSHYIYYVTITLWFPRKTFFFHFFEFSNSNFPTLSVELTQDMGIIRKLSTWTNGKKSQKFQKLFLRLSKALSNGPSIFYFILIENYLKLSRTQFRNIRSCTYPTTNFNFPIFDG